MDYHSKYGHFTFRNGDLGCVFGDGSNKHANPLITRTPRVILTAPDFSVPVVNSFEPEYLDMLCTLKDELNVAIKPELDSQGFSLNGAHSTADNIGCVAGYMMDRMSYPSVDSDGVRKDIGLRVKDYPARWMSIGRELITIAFAEWLPSDVKVPKKSTSGTPRYTTDAVWKQDYALWLLEPSNLEDLIATVKAGDKPTLASRFEMIFMMYLQTRLQTESIGKKRLVNDLQFARTGGRKGTRTEADKRVEINGKEYPELSAMRARVINAGPWTINCLLQTVFSGHMQRMFHDFPDVFHVNTAEDIKRLVDGHYVFAGDVKEYDGTIPSEMLDLFHEIMGEAWCPEIATMSQWLMEAPYYSRPLDMHGDRGVFVGDPFSSDKVYAGNRSGHAATSFIAKLFKVWDDLVLIDMLMKDVVGNVRRYLEGKMVIKVINNGDDHVIYSREQSLIDAIRELRKSPNVTFFHVEEEKGQVFSGNIIMKDGVDDVGRPVYRCYTRLYTFLERVLAPERSAGSNLRKYWPIGVYDRFTHAAERNPLGDAALRVFLDVWNHHLAPTKGDFMGVVADAMRGVPSDFAALDSISMEVLSDPDKIHYKYADSVIDPAVLAAITSKIPAALVKHVGTMFYNGRIQESHE